MGVFLLFRSSPSVLADPSALQNPPAEIMQACKEEVDEVCRVLAPGGIFLYL